MRRRLIVDNAAAFFEKDWKQEAIVIAEALFIYVVLSICCKVTGAMTFVLT